MSEGNEGNGIGREGPNTITEELIWIGYNAAGQLAFEVHRSLNPAAAVIMLEQIRQSLVGQFRFQRERKVDLAPAGSIKEFEARGRKG